MKTVGVIGGGIGGLTVADELSYRGYEVHVFERDPALLGGKASSHGFRAEQGWKMLPAEHGFRFFPGFYANVVKTMEHIPYPGGGVVAERLTRAEYLRYSFNGPTTGCVVSPLGYKALGHTVAGSFWDLFGTTKKKSGVTTPTLFTDGDLAYLGALFASIRMSSKADRLDLEKIDFRTYVIDEFPKTVPPLKPSQSLQEFLALGSTRMLVAAQAEKMSARTGLVTLVRLLDPKVMAAAKVDRLLEGPTSPEWIDPWVKDLRSTRVGRTPVTFHLGRTVTGLQVQGQRVAAFTTAPGSVTHQFDHVVLAVPHAAAEQLLAPHQSSLPAALGGLAALRSDWMVGAQYYLSQEPDICRGHVMYVNSPWALTSVCQAQFWSGFPWPSVGDGSVRDVLSVCISDWDTPGVLHQKPAKQCTLQEIRDEVWAQMAESLNDVGSTDLPPDQSGIVRAFTLDPGINFDAQGTVADNATPLYINTAGSWHDRPPVDPGMENLFLAGDYVRTNADLATMESANESGKRAANAILDRDGRMPDVKVRVVDNLGLL